MGSEYINASRIESIGAIAAQGPKENTLGTFFSMVLEAGGPIINMAKAEELGEKKYSAYDKYEGNVPEKGINVNESPEIIFGQEANIRHMSSEEITDSQGNLIGYKNTFQVVDLKQEPIKYPKDHPLAGQPVKTIEQYHYIKWPDHGVPKDSQELVYFLNTVRVETSMAGNANKEPVFHCSAGVGRSGVAMAVYKAMKDAEAGKELIDATTSMVEMRKHRSIMIQTHEQLILTHNIIESLRDSK